MDIYTIQSTAVELDKSTLWVRYGVWLGKIKAEMVGGRYLITGPEVRRVKENPFRISQKEMDSCGKK